MGFTADNPSPDGSQPATPKKHWSYIERRRRHGVREGRRPRGAPAAEAEGALSAASASAAATHAARIPREPSPLPSPPPAPHLPPSPPPPDPFAALVERKLRRLESYRSAAALSERADEALPRKIQRRLAKLEAFAEMYELNGETLPDPVPKFVQPKKANKHGQKSCADLEWPVGNPTLAIPSSAARRPRPARSSATTRRRSTRRSRHAQPPEPGSAATTRSPRRGLVLIARLTTRWSGRIVPAAKGSTSNALRTAARASASPLRKRISRRFAAAPTASDANRISDPNPRENKYI